MCMVYDDERVEYKYADSPRIAIDCQIQVK